MENSVFTPFYQYRFFSFYLRFGQVHEFDEQRQSSFIRYIITFIIKIEELMEAQIKQKNKNTMFTKGHLSSPGQLLCSANVSRKGTETKVQIYENGLYDEASKQSMPFDFDLKFGFKPQVKEVCFEKGDTKLTYQLLSDEDLNTWRIMLKLKLNQRGFHQQFKALDKIGKGNFASVYLVEKHQDKNRYAVKAFSKEAAYSQQKGKQCLIKQIQIMRHLTHPNNMRLFQIFESQNSLYIVFELLSGGSLHDKIKSKYKFKSSEIQTITHGILLGMKQMSQKRIMHRDLKPENLLFRNKESFDCVIADYGLAQFANSEEYLFVRCGTPGYVAPEVINIKDMKTKYDPICDMFSLGLIFHLLLMGKSAFPGKNYDQVLSQNRASNINLKGQQYKKLSPETLDLLEKMLKKNPKQRMTPQQALAHLYFEQTNEISDQVGGTGSEYPELNSPLFATKNAERKQLNKKDSCVDFKLGKQNLLTGKTQPVSGSVHTKLSGINFQGLKSPAMVSKFAQRK